MIAQSVIIPLPSKYAKFISFNLNKLSLEGFKEQLLLLFGCYKRLLVQYPECGLKYSVSFSPSMWKKLYPKEVNNGFHSLKPIEGKVSMPSLDNDVFFHIASQRTDICFELANSFFHGIEHLVEITDSKNCFRYLEGRDLTGFVDGIENPQTRQDREDTVLFKTKNEYKDGTFLFTQRYVHNLDKWKQTKTEEQEKVFGRTKLDSVEFSEKVKPKTAHISRTKITDKDGEELKIIRHSLPYGETGQEKGLYFVAYSFDQQRIEEMLNRMYGNTGDNLSDNLLNFVTPVNGSFYFTPSEELLYKVVGAE